MTLTFTQLSRIIDDLGYPECGYPVSRSNSYVFALSSVITHIDSRDADNIADTDEVKRFIRIVDIA